MRLFYFISIFTVFGFCNAQEFKFGEVNTAILEETQDDFFPDSSIKVVYKRILLDYNKDVEIHERVKIYNEEGFDGSNWEIYYPDISRLQAFTYNLENGVIEKTQVGKNSIFSEEPMEGYEITKISFPKVRKGSVIELRYKLKNVRVNEIPIQSDVPIENFRLVIQGISPWMDFKQNPNYEIDLREEATENEKLKIFTAKNIPAIKPAPYVNNIKNYTGKLFIKSKKEDDDNLWGELTAGLNSSLYFGAQLKTKPFFGSDILPLIHNRNDSLGVAKNVYHFLQEKMEYNGRYGTSVYDLKKTYDKEIGDKADINFLLVLMLRHLGFRANPMIVACKHKGEVLFPERNAFNATLCALQIEDDFYVLDASEDFAPFGVIPLDMVNGYGLIILDDGRSISYPTNNLQHSSINTIVNTSIDVENRVANGSVHSQLTNHLAWAYKEVASDEDKDSFEKAISEIYPLLSIEAFSDSIKENDVEAPVELSYDFSYADAIEEIGGQIYVSPFLFLGNSENKYIEKTRAYPLDLEFPKRETYAITFNIPEGYTVESLPKNKKITLQDNLGSLVFLIQQQMGKVQLRLNVQVNYDSIPASFYGALQELYDAYTEISKSKIVLSKI